MASKASKTQLEVARMVKRLGPFQATPTRLLKLGYYLPTVHAAVRAGLIRWTDHGSLEACHDQFAGSHCIEGPDGCCVTCGVAMTTCEACSGVGYHTATCAESDERES